MTRIRQTLRALVDLCFPSTCAACGAAAPIANGVCVACAQVLRSQVAVRTATLTLSEGDCLRVCSVIDYDERMRRLLNSFKDGGRVDTAVLLAKLLRAALRSSVAGDAKAVWLVPVPSSDAAVRRRGYRHLELLIQRALPAAGVVQGLRYTRRVRDQAGLGRMERAQNLRGAVRASSAVAGLRCVVVDDVMTTGATLRESVVALRDAGAHVVAAAVIARVPLNNTRAGEST